MKTLIILILFCTSLYGADITTTNIGGDITTKISERSGEDGKSRLRVETVSRGKTTVLRIVSQRNKQGALAVVSRAYYVDGRLHMAESDEDGDGFFESVAVFDPATDDVEMFTRQPNGIVKPVSTQELNSMKKVNATIDASMSKLFDGTEMTDKELGEWLAKTREKVEAISKEEKKNGD